MPNYIAQSPSVPSAPRPVVDVGDIIDSASRAFENNKRGIMTRAIMQQKAAEAKQVQARQDAQFRLEQQRFTLAQRQQQTQEQMHAADLLAKGYEDVTGQPETTRPDGTTPAARVTIGERAYRLNSNNTPDARKKSDRLKKLQAYNDALPATDPKRLKAEDIDLLSNDDSLFNTFTTHRLGLTNDPFETHKKERIFDIQNPLPTKSGQSPDDKTEHEKRKYLQGRLKELTKPVAGRNGRKQPGLAPEAALEQATKEWDLVHNDESPVTSPTPKPATSGDINLGDSQPNHLADADYAEAAALYQQALKRPDVDHAHAREVYNEAVAAIAKKHGQLK